jgi:hypothetical protein
MIVSHKHRFLFVEVPQTGSTAIAKELLEQYGCEEILHKHAHLREFLNQASADERSYKVAAGTRHPLDRVLGHHTKLRNNHRDAYDDPTRFEENGGWVSRADRAHFAFVKESEGDFGAYLRRYYGSRSVKVSQYAWGRSRYGQLIRFEHLNDDFHSFLRSAGVEPLRDLPLTNPTAGRDKDFWSAYPEDIRAHLCFTYGPLAAEWGYSFPEDWGGKIPFASRAQYALKNIVGRLATEVFHVTPRHYQRARVALGRG